MEASEAKIVGLKSQHESEMDNLRDHFRKFRAAQQEVVTTLEAQLHDLTHGEDYDDLSDLAADHTYVSYDEEFSSGLPPQEAQIQLNKLAARHRLKRLELNAILKAISSAGASVSSDRSSITPSMPPITGVQQRPQGASLEEAGDKEQDAWSMGALTRIVPLREELLEARVTAADKEMESLHEALERERRIVVSLRNQLNDMQVPSLVTGVHDIANTETELESTGGFELPTVIVSGISQSNKLTADNFMKRVNSYCRNSKRQIIQLKKDLKTEREKGNKEDVPGLKAQLFEAKSEISSLREENARKAKLLSTFKASRSADFNAIEQWRQEATDTEERVKHLKSSIMSKENIIKDLRQKLSKIENTATDASVGGDYSSMTVPELKNKLKASDLEIKRCKMRLSAFREKVVDLERTVEPLKAENAKLQLLAEKSDALKSAISRKDALLKNYKEQAEKSKVDFDALREVAEARRVDLEKKNR